MCLMKCQKLRPPSPRTFPVSSPPKAPSSWGHCTRHVSDTCPHTCSSSVQAGTWGEEKHLSSEIWMRVWPEFEDKGSKWRAAREPPGIPRKWVTSLRSKEANEG